MAALDLPYEIWIAAGSALVALACLAALIASVRGRRRAERDQARAAARYAPFDIGQVPYEGFRKRAPADGRVKGDLGELIAGLAAVGEGWRWIDVKWGRDRGVDGLFVREDPERPGTVLVKLVEVKNTRSRPDLPARQLTDAHLVATLGEFWRLSGKEAAAKKKLVEQIIYALNARRTPKNLTRELWWIRLDEEAVDVYPCGRKGEPCAPMTRKSLPALFEALRNGLELLDRGEHYLRPPSAPEPSPDFHPRYRARPAYPGDFMPGLPPVPGEDAPRD